MKVLSRLNIKTKAADNTGKYKPGEFGYWWTVEKGNDDIEGKVYDRYIICSEKNLTSLRGCPKEVKGDFFCSQNKLTSLEGGPQKVGGYFDCSNNKLTSLKGAPKQVGGGFYCSNNKLTTLDGAPEKVGDFICVNNRLKDLKGAPKEITGNFICCDNPLVSLDGLPRKIKKDLKLPDIESFGGEDAINKLSQIGGDIMENSYI